jgi:hypothetical protein
MKSYYSSSSLLIQAANSAWLSLVTTQADELLRHLFHSLSTMRSTQLIAFQPALGIRRYSSRSMIRHDDTPSVRHSRRYFSTCEAPWPSGNDKQKLVRLAVYRMKVADLRRELAHLDMDSSGTKAALVPRLLAVIPHSSSVRRCTTRDAKSRSQSPILLQKVFIGGGFTRPLPFARRCSASCAYRRRLPRLSGPSH